MALVERWSRSEAPGTTRMVEVRSFPDGARVHVRAERSVTRTFGASTITSWIPVEWVVDAQTGETVPGERVLWVPTEAEIARARAQKAVDQASLRAVSRDGSLLVFVLGRGWTESPDPDAGTVVSCDASVGLWDAAAGAWRWETSRTPDEMGVGSWLFEQAGFEWSFDESGVFGRVGGKRTSTLLDVADGALRPVREGDRLPVVMDQEGTPLHVLAADARRSHAVVARGSVVMACELGPSRLAHAFDLAPLDDRPTAATTLDRGASIVVGTENGRLLRLDGRDDVAQLA